MPADDRRLPRPRRASGAHQLRRLRQIPAFPVRWRVRAAARSVDDQDAVRADAAEGAAPLAARVWAAHTRPRSGADGFLVTAVTCGLTPLLRHVAKTYLIDVSTRLPEFSNPVIVVWGQADRCFPPALVRRLAALFQHG